MEVPIENYIIDVVQGNELIEIQTRNFSQIREKLISLLNLGYKVTLVHPVVQEKVFRTRREDQVSVRTSPKRENLLAIFNELIFIPELFNFKNFKLEIVFTKIEIERNALIKNKFKIIDKKLVEITKTIKFEKAQDFLFIIPYELQLKLTTKNLMQRLGINYPLACKIVYFFVKTKMLKMIQKESNLKIYQVKKNI